MAITLSRLDFWNSSEFRRIAVQAQRFEKGADSRA